MSVSKILIEEFVDLKENKVYFKEINLILDLYLSSGTHFFISNHFGSTYIKFPKYIIEKGYISKQYYDRLILAATNLLKKEKPLNIPYLTLNYVYFLGKKLPVTKFKAFEKEKNYLYVKKLEMKYIIEAYDNLILKNIDQYLQVDTQKLKINKQFRIKLGEFRTIYADIFVKRNPVEIHFDRRIFAFHPYVFNSVILHELCHLYYTNHSKNFYTLLRLFSPQENKVDKIFKKGDFTYVPDKQMW